MFNFDCDIPDGRICARYVFVFEVATDPNLAKAAFSDLLNQFYPLLG